MKIYDDKHIKNVAFVGAHNSGKTTLAETMLFEAGLLNRRGTVEQKHSFRLPRNRTRKRDFGLCHATSYRVA